MNGKLYNKMISVTTESHNQSIHFLIITFYLPIFICDTVTIPTWCKMRHKF